MNDELFDKSDEYDEMLNRGLALSGEDKSYFLAGRVSDLVAQLPKGFVPSRILDFGCGIGDSTAHLAEWFPEAIVVGADTAARAVSHATRTHASDRVSFCTIDALAEARPFDLCYINGVFHHIPKPNRPRTMSLLKRLVRGGGLLALFENNPLNPGTLLVMSRVPFDRDAETLTHREARRLVESEAFGRVQAVRFLFYFPRFMARLRPLEPHLVGLPFGAQYWLLVRRS